MSFSTQVQPTKPDADAIRERLDGLEPSPPIVNPAGQAAFAKAKEAFAALATNVASGEFNIVGSISGHFYQEGYSRQNNIAVSVSETTLDTPEDAEAKKAAAQAEAKSDEAPPELGTPGTPNGAPPEETVEAPAEQDGDEPSEETLKVEEELADEGVSSEGIPGQPTEDEPTDDEAVEGDEPEAEPEPAPAETGLTSRNP